MYKDLKDKVVVITGGSSGIGREIALRFASEHAKIIFNYLASREEAEKASQKISRIGGKSAYIQADVSKEDDVIRLTNFAIEQFGGLDVWVNNAGIETKIDSDEMSISDWENVLRVNLTGTFIGCREVIKYFKKTQLQGSIINLSSVHETIPWPKFAHYAAAKGGTKMLTKTLALEYAKQNIRINSVAPGAINTPINADKFENHENVEKTISMIPMGRIGKASEVASAVAWLASSESRYVTGQSIVVDGGMMLYPSFENGEG